MILRDLNAGDNINTNRYRELAGLMVTTCYERPSQKITLGSLPVGLPKAFASCACLEKSHTSWRRSSAFGHGLSPMDPIMETE
jgi:hypothetical protein